MPIPERVALETMNLLPNLPEADRPRAVDFLRQYREQQAALKEPEFPSADRERITRVMKMRTMFQDREGHGFTREERENFDAALVGMDEESRYKALNRAFIAEATGSTPDKLNGSYEGLRDAYAKQTWGSEKISEKDFFTRIADDFDREDDISAKASQAAVADAMDGKRDWMKAYAAAGFDESKFPDKFAAWEWRERFRLNYERTEAEAAPFAQEAKAFVEGLQRTMTGEAVEGEDAALTAFRERLIDAPYDERQAMLRAVTIYGAKIGEDPDKGGVGGWFQQAGESAARIVSGMTTDTATSEIAISSVPASGSVFSRGVIDSPEKADQFVFDQAATFVSRTRGDLSPVPMAFNLPGVDRELSAEESALIEFAKARALRGVSIAREIERISQSTDPILRTFGGITASTLGSSAAIIGPLLLSPTMAFPIASGYSNLEYTELRLKQPDLAFGDAKIISTVSGAAQAALDLAGVRALKALPSFRGILSGGATREIATRALKQTGKVYAFENAIEGLQDITTPVVQSIFSALANDVPNVDWDSEWNHWKSTRVDVAIGMLPLTLLGTGATTLADVRSTRRMLSDAATLRASGLDPDAVNNIVDLASQGKAKEATDALKVAWPNRKPASQEAFDAIAKDQQTRMDAFTRLEQAGKLPAMRRTSDGWALVDQEGTLTEFGSHAEADQARWDYAKSQALAIPEQVRQTIRQLETELEAGREIAVEFSPERMDVARAESEGLASGQAISERMEAGQALASNVAGEYQEAVDSTAVASIDAETAAASAQILGMNQSRWVDGIQKTTIKLWQGASPLTIVEEKLESDVAKMLKDGRAPWLVSALREYEKTSGDRLFRDVESDDMLTGQDIREAYSHLGTAYFVGKSSRDPGTAIADRGFRKLAADLMRTRLGGILTAYGHFFRSVFKRAAKLRKLTRDGRMNPELERELARSLGISDQQQEQEAQLAEAERLAMELQDTAQKRATIHRVFEGGTPMTVRPGPGVLDARNPNLAFRITGKSQIDDMLSSGQVRAKDGKMRGGRSGETQWSKGHESLGYRASGNPGKFVIVTPVVGLHQKKGGLPISEVSKIWEEKNGEWNDVTVSIKEAASERLAIELQDTLTDTGFVPTDDAPFSVIAPGPGYKKTALPDGSILEGPASFSILAYHGTPHKVDKFSLDKIGTGEGAQVYGWGLYFSGTYAVAYHYAVTVGSKPSKELVSEMANSGLSDFAVLAKKLKSEGKNSNLVTEAERLSSRKKGNLYTVELLADDPDFLDWDKPLSEQSDKVKTGLTAAFGKLVQLDGKLASEWYSAMTNPRDGETDVKSFAEDANKAGIRGIRYFDGNSRNRPFNEIKREFLDALPEDASFDDVLEAIDDEVFNSNQVAFLNALKENDWLGFDYPAQAISAALSDKIRNWDPGKNLVDSIPPLRGDASYNYVIFDESLVKIIAENGTPVEGETGFSVITPAQDAAYLQAVEAGDMAKAQRMADEAANDADLEEWFHGNTKSFGGFSSTDLGVHLGTEESAQDRLDQTGQTSGVVSRYYVDIKNPVKLQYDPDTWQALDVWSALPKDIKNKVEDSYQYVIQDLELGELKTELKKLGFDGIKYPNAFEGIGDSILVFEDSQIKSADPVVYANGNVIPLSQRFNTERDEITFSAIPRNVATDPLDFEARLVAKFDPFQRSPELRVQIMQDVQRRTAEALRKWQPAAALAGRTKADIAAERKQRIEAGISDRIGTLSATELDALAYPDTVLNAKDYPVFNELLTRKSYTRKDGRTVLYWAGRLESPSAYKKRTGDKRAPDEYDGMGDLPKWVFGGTLRPDEAADELGLGSTNDLWDALHSAINSARMRTAEYEAAEAKLDAIEQEAKADADEWAARETARLDANSTQRENLTGALRTLNAMIAALPPEIRGKVGGFVTLSQKVGPAAMLRELMSRAEKIDAELESFLRKDIDRQVRKLLDKAKPAKDQAGKKRVGKAGADVHSLFDAIRQAIKLNGDETEALAASFDELASNPDSTPEIEAHNLLAANMVRLFGDWRNADAQRRFTALENATAVWLTGYNEWQTKVAKEREARQAIRDALVIDAGAAGKAGNRDRKAIEANGFGGWLKQSFLNLLPFEGVARYLFGDNSTEALRLADMERESSGQYQDEVFAEVSAIDDLFTGMAGGDLAGQRLRYSLAQKDVEIGDRLLSQLEMIQALLMWRQEDGKRHMIGQLDEAGQPSGPWHYGDAFIAEVEAKLSSDAREVMAFISGGYAGEYDKLNPIFRDLNGIDLPRVKDYAPITVAPVQASGAIATDPVSGLPVSGRSTTPGALLSRGRAIAEPEFRDALQTYIAHKKQMGYWKAYAKFNRDARAILGNREVSNAVTGKGTDEAKKVLGLWLDDFAQGGNREAQSHLALAKGIQGMTNRFAAVALVGRISTLLLQSSQITAAMAEMPFGAYMSRFAKLMTGQLQYGDALASPYIQRRVQEMPPIVRQGMEGLAAGKPNAVKLAAQRLAKTIPGADAIFTAGTYAIVRDFQLAQARKMGLPEADAVIMADAAAQRVTDRVAQPTRRGARSIFENTSSGMMRLVWAFSSDARKNIGLIVGAGLRGNKTDVGRAILFAVLANGIFSQVIRNFWRDIRDDEDEEVFDSKHWDPARLALGILADPLYGFPVIGSTMEAAIFAATGQYMPQGNPFEAVPRAIQAINRIDDYAAGEGELEDAMRDLESVLSAMGLFSETMAGFASFSHLLRDGVAITEDLAGED